MSYDSKLHGDLVVVIAECRFCANSSDLGLVNPTTTKMNPKNKTSEPTSIPEEFQHLIPAQAVSKEALTKISADFLHLRNETAIGLKTDSPVLASKELARFKENCRMIGAITLGIELRNYLLWEVYSTGQFRETDQDFVAFGTRLANIKKAQLMRCVHAGRIRIAMIHAKLDDIGPNGRQVEELSKIPAERTVEAWLHALEHMRAHGRSDAMAREGLLDYCRVNKIPFGKRMPNGSRKSGIQRALRRRGTDKAGTPSEEPHPDDEPGWSLSPREEQLILGIAPSPAGVVNAPDEPERLSRHIAALRKVASNRIISEYDAYEMEALLALVMRKDEETGRSLAIVALQSLRDLVMSELQPSPPPEETETT